VTDPPKVTDPPMADVRSIPWECMSAILLSAWHHQNGPTSAWEYIPMQLVQVRVFNVKGHVVNVIDM
jgi:hypothetical protein